MKNLRTILALSSSLMCSTSIAAPLYYTFEGSITTISHDNAGAIASAGFSVGSSVTYTLLIDFDAAASETHFGGYVDYDSYLDTGSWDYFYVDYIGGDALTEVDGGFYNTVGPADGTGSMNASEKNWGYDTLVGVPGGFLHTNSDDDQLQLKNIGLNVSDWVIGTTIIVDNWAFDSANNQSQLFAEVQLTSISSVPVPAAVWLFSSGLIGLAGLARRKNF